MRIFGYELEMVALDYDGVIVKFTTVIRDTLIETGQQYGLPQENVIQYMTYLGTPKWAPNLLAGIKCVWPEVDDSLVPEIALTFRQLEKSTNFEPKGQSIEAIRQMLGMGLKVGLCTANDDNSLALRLRCVGLEASEFTGINRIGSKFCKPHPQALHDLFEVCEVAPNKALYVGDWEADLTLAREADVRFVAITTPPLMDVDYFQARGVPEDHIIHCLSGLVAKIEQ